MLQLHVFYNWIGAEAARHFDASAPSKNPSSGYPGPVYKATLKCGNMNKAKAIEKIFVLFLEMQKHKKLLESK